jgi:hypothetical protein
LETSPKTGDLALRDAEQRGLALKEVDPRSAVERQPTPELAHDPEAIGGVVPRIVEGVRDEDVDRVIGLSSDHEAAALEEREEVRNEGRVIHTNAHGPYIGTALTMGDSENWRAR